MIYKNPIFCRNFLDATAPLLPTNYYTLFVTIILYYFSPNFPAMNHPNPNVMIPVTTLTKVIFGKFPTIKMAMGEASNKPMMDQYA